MKKLESLTLSKFKSYELKKESHNMVMGGTTILTGPCKITDNADDKSKTVNGGGAGVDTWSKEDITVKKTPSAS